MSQLDSKYRPRTFGDVTGQRPAVALLYLMTRKRDVPGGMLFYGKWGSGKTSLARITAMALNCEAPPGKAAEWPCGACSSCTAIEADNHPDVEELDAASNGTVGKISELRERASYGTVSGQYKVYIIDEAHGLSAAAADSLLKIVEEARPGLLFILCTTQLRSIPRTIQSRCSPFRFDPLPASAVRARLTYICAAEGYEIEPALLTAIAEASGGVMRDAVVRLDQVASAGIGSLDLWQELTGETDFAPGLLAAAADGNEAGMYAAMDEALSSVGDAGQVTRELTRCLADLLVLSCGEPVNAQGRALAVRQELLGRLGKARVSKAMAVLWDLMTKIRAEDRTAGLQVALAVLSRCLCPQQAAPIAPAAGGEKSSLAELKTALEGV